MIYTCTLNPSLDYFIQVDHFQTGELNRMASEKKMPGGKGINVSRVLNRLNVPSLATGFLGGFTGDFILKQLSQEEMATDFIQIDGDTRINVKLKSDTETEVNGVSPKITSEHVGYLMGKLDHLAEGDILVLSGSLPDSVPIDLYRKMTEHVRKNNVKVIVDTSGQALKEVIKASPFLIKPNHKELGQLFDVQIDTNEKAVHFAKKLINQGIGHVVVSMGDKGALMITDETVYHAEVPQGTVKNSVGSGDSLVGGFLAKYAHTGDIKRAFQYGAAAGSATAFSVDLCTLEHVEQLLPEVNITNWEKGDHLL